MGLAAAAITGNTRWVSIGCKFPDRLDEEHPWSYFAGMYGDDFPGLNHYWHEVSNEHINLDGSTAIGWYILPKRYTGYISYGYFDFKLFRNDCLAAADADVYFPDYYGINLIVNGDDLDTASGGLGLFELDGVTRQWGYTHMTQWTHKWISEFEHEMGHGYGLFHSYVNNQPGPYYNVWDVMSRDEYNCADFYDPVYGCYGQHTVAYNKAKLGWIEPNRIYMAGQGKHTVTLERSALPGPANYLMVKIPVNDSSTHYFTLEARRLVGYDNKVPGNAVIIHEHGNSAGPSLVAFNSPADNRAAMWIPGEQFNFGEGGITVRIDAATLTGFVVTIKSGLSPAVKLLGPTDDTTLKRLAPSTNYGLLPVLQAEPSIDNWISTSAALKFDAEDIPETAFRLRLWLAAIDDAGATIPNVDYWLSPFYSRTSVPWVETYLTWNNRGELYPLPEGTTERDGIRVEWNVSSILAYREEGAGNTFGSPSFALGGGDASEIVTYSSKEGPNPPQLIVDYLVEPGSVTPTPTATQTPSPTPTATPGGLPAPVLADIDNDDGDGSFVVTWLAVTGADGYRLREGVDGAEDVAIYTGPDTSFARNNLPAGVYCYRVRATIVGSQWGPYSEPKCTTVNEPGSTPTSTPTPSSTPDGGTPTPEPAHKIALPVVIGRGS